MLRRTIRPDQATAGSDASRPGSSNTVVWPPSPLRLLLLGLWLLVLVGLGLQAWQQGSLVGSYDPGLDQLLYAGQRRLVGALSALDFVNGTPLVAQYLYAPSAWLGNWLGTLRPHRLLMLALTLFGSGLLWSSLRQLGSLGWLPLRRHSLVPPFAALLYVVFVQLFPLGFSGLLPSIIDTLLLLAVCLVIRAVTLRARMGGAHGSGAAARGPASGASVSLALAGAVLLLSVNALPSLFSPLLLLAVLLVLLLEPRWPWPLVLPVLGGGFLALLLLLPYLAQPGGLVRAWAGAVQLPLELASRGSGSPQGEFPLKRLAQLLTLNVAGLPLWLFGLVPVLELLRRWRTGGRALLLLPALAVLFSLDLLLALQGGDSSRNDLVLLVPPLLLLISAGLASLESSPQRRLRRTAAVTLLLVSLILCNNVFLAAALHPARAPKAPLLELEHDRAAVRAYVSALHPAPTSLQVPQDTALLRELALASASVGVGPDWSLDQQNLPSSWATRLLGLPVGPAEACRQLTAARHDLVIWMRTDSRGPNSEASLRACLASDGARWQPLAEPLGLRSGQIQVFRRLAPALPCGRFRCHNPGDWPVARPSRPGRSQPGRDGCSSPCAARLRSHRRCSWPNLPAAWR